MEPPLSLADSEQYAIIDGPELDHGIRPQLPTLGTATYSGQAGGLYSYTPHGSANVLEEYQATVTLAADFAHRTLKGCVGCVGDIVPVRKHFNYFLGNEVIDREDVAKDYELHLAPAPLREDGMFESTKVTVTHPERTVATSEGFWGGAVSSRRDAVGNPRLAAGFNIVSFGEEDGSEGLFVGSFLGLSEDFRKTGVSRPPAGGDG